MNPVSLQSPTDGGCGDSCAVPMALGRTHQADAPTDSSAAVFRIPLMDCAAEESDIRHALDRVAGIRSLRFHLARRTLSIDATPDVLAQALEAVKRAGYPATQVPADEPVPDGDEPTACAHHGHDHVHNHPHEHGVATPSGSGIARYAVALALAVGAEGLAFLAPDTWPWKLTGMALAAAAIALAGFATYTKGLAALRHARLNINALMTVAVTGAFLIGQWPEAAMVMALYAIAEWIEARAVDRARNAIAGLLDLTPESAEVQQADGSWRAVPSARVPVDALIRIKPGARIALDGVVMRGASAVDQSAVTGESLPVDKAAGAPVFAGTINQTGLLEVRVLAAANNTLIARIIHAVEQAQGSRAPTQQFVDRFARIYTPAVFGLAVAVALLMPWLMDLSWTQAIYKALVLLVIACPCALVISTPVSVVSGLAAAARRGILIKGGVYLENAHKIRALALDKTGTITEGRPQLVATELLGSRVPEAQVLRWAAALAAHSDHPVSQAIACGLAPNGDPLEGFTALLGRGTQARADGQTLVLGNHRLIEERGLCSAAIEARLAEHEKLGRTATLLASSDEVLAIFAVADTIKASSREALGELHALGVTTVMLTGDNPATATTIAREAGISDARGNLLPDDKLAAIEDLQKRHGITAMVGDGINDAPALARADIGIAMGGAGTDIAMEAADVVIMNDDLRRIPEAIRLSRRTHRVLRQNIALALGIKAVFLALAVFDNATMWMAVFADMGASLLVVANGLRLLRGPRAG